MSLSNYLQKNSLSPITRGSLFENVRNRDVDDCINKIATFLRKRGIYLVPLAQLSTIDGITCFSVFGFTNENHGCLISWKQSDTTSIDTIMFTKEYDKSWVAYHNNESFKWDACISLKGASITRAIQLVADVLKGKTDMSTSALNKAIRDAQLWECVQEKVEDIEFEDYLMEDNNDTIIRDLRRRKDNLYQRIKEYEKKGKDTQSLQDEYDKLKYELEDARASVRANVPVTPINDPAINRIEARFEEEVRATPEERFGDMESYITKVIVGLRPSALICGAPGVGKTYRIMQLIKKANKHQFEDYYVIKGKCTPMVLFKTLHDYQKKGQIIVIDDADEIITDDTAINLIKAATDSSDERIVSYGSNAKIFASEEEQGLYDDLVQDNQGRWCYPRDFVFEGGVIIITNINAGSIDTAIRNRALICDLSFNVKEVLGLVENLTPHIKPDVLTPDAKMKALEFLRTMAEAGDAMEVSIRSFIIVAEEYMSDAPQASIERRIREQMRWQAARGGKHY